MGQDVFSTLETPTAQPNSAAIAAVCDSAVFARRPEALRNYGRFETISRARCPLVVLAVRADRIHAMARSRAIMPWVFCLATLDANCKSAILHSVRQLFQVAVCR
jgi:hypothetical protein